jgi:hypothetical protein
MTTGLGVLINQLFNGKGTTQEVLQAAVNKVIRKVELVDDILVLTFDKFKVLLEDTGQYCCENRYMTTDDDLTYYIGAELWDVEIRPAPSLNDDDSSESHDVEFLVVKTNKGEFVMESHNEHNGYYGGFSINARMEKV